ncbi:MAG: amino acid--tRNA ligase-related protein, partial [Elusimicrobiota bacterium]
LEEGEPDKKIFDHIFDSLIQPKLQSLTFVTCYPLAFSPLAKRTEQDERLADRFELFVCGEEIANAYSELNDPEEQNRRFSANIKPSDADKEHVLDTEFIEAIEYGMPPCGGLGIGIDRLTMVLTGVRSIRDVILFPLLRPEDK